MVGFNATVVLPQNFQVTWQSSCVLWLRADKGTTIATGVSAWVDQTTNAHSYAQATGSAQPTLATVNGQSSLRFTKSASQFLSNSGWNLAIPMDVFVVGQLASVPSGQQAFFDKGDAGDGHQNIGYFNGSATNLSQYAGVGFSVTVTAGTTALAVYRFSIQNAGSVIYANGVNKGTGTSGDPGATKGGIGNIGANISGASNFDGWISEVIEFSSIQSSSVAEQVTKYLGARYGIVVT